MAFPRRPGKGALYIWLSVILTACSSSVVRVLADLGDHHTVDGRNPISFCNLLCAGNVCALLAILVLFQRELSWLELRRVARKGWVTLLLITIATGTIGPWLTFEAIKRTTVTNIVFISQLEPPLLLLLCWLFRGEVVSALSGLSATVCFIGVALSLLLGSAQDLAVGSGEILMAIVAVISAISTTVAKGKITDIPIGLVMLFRNLVGTLLFSAIALHFYGPRHFADLASPFLWQWVVLYGAIVVFGGQVTWFTGLRKASALDITLASSAYPLVGVLAAFLILGEIPSTAHYMGGTVLLVGLGTGIWGSTRAPARKVPPPPDGQTTAILGAESMTRFKGI